MAAMTALFALGNHYQHQGQFAAAIACYQRALQEQPDNVALLCNLGVALAARGAVAEAMAHFQQALRLRADAAIAWCNLGHLLRLQGQLEAASEHLQQAVRLCPGVAEAHNNLGAVYLEQGDSLPRHRAFTRSHPAPTGLCRSPYQPGQCPAPARTAHDRAGAPSGSLTTLP